MLQDDLFFMIESSRMSFTDVDMLIAQYFLDEKPMLKQAALASRLNVSAASVTRFCKKIGVENYKELIYFYKKVLMDAQEDKNHITNNLQYQYTELVNDIDRKIDVTHIQKVCELIEQKNVIHLFGLGMSAIAGEDFKFRFTRLGKYIEVVHDYDSIEMISSLLDKNNLVIYFSLRGENNPVKRSIQRLYEKGATIVLVTSNESSNINKYAHITLFTSRVNKTDTIGEISGQIPLLIIIDLIYSQYINMYKENISKWIHTEHAYLHGHDTQYE